MEQIKNLFTKNNINIKTYNVLQRVDCPYSRSWKFVPEHNVCPGVFRTQNYATRRTQTDIVIRTVQRVLNNRQAKHSLRTPLQIYYHESGHLSSTCLCRTLLALKISLCYSFTKLLLIFNYTEYADFFFFFFVF